MSTDLLVYQGRPTCAHCGAHNWVHVTQASQGEHMLCRSCGHELWPIGVVRLGNSPLYVYPLPTHSEGT